MHRSFIRMFSALMPLWMAVGAAQGQSIVFSEIMYHPLDAATAPTDGDEYEFIELFNAGGSAVDLSGAAFTDGIAYTFPNGVNLASGAYLVVARNLAAFSNRYGGAISVMGPYSGALKNSGEKVTLRDAQQNTLFSVTYGDSAPWPEEPDGYGFSLVFTNYTGDPNSPAHWAAGKDWNGSPGTYGGAAVRDVVINEILTHTDPPLEDAIELHNLSTNAISVLGWYISDDITQPDKYRITNSAPIAANGYVVFYEQQFNSGSASFAFSESGEQAFLFAVDGQSNITRLVDFVEFEAAENGVSFGRYPNGTGDLVTLSNITFGTTNPATLNQFRSGQGAPNSAAKVGPIVIAEIMYNPLNDNAEDEYIELLNIGDVPVPLFDGSNTWTLISAVDYTFPTGIVMAAGERILITGATNESAFRSGYNLPSNTVILSAWSGRLNNAGESVRLYKPGNPEPTFVPAIQVERVDYSDLAPWPTEADGKGPSLERLDETQYANTAANWFAGAPGGSPGTAPVGGLVNPQISPASPSAWQALTFSVLVVASSLPTQVMMRTAIHGVETETLMVDNGLGPDLVAGDQRYSAALDGQADGTWIYTRFEAWATNGLTYAYPVRKTEFIPSPTLTVRMANAGLLTTVQPSNQWHTYTTQGTATDPDTFYILLNGEGEALVDDISFVDASFVEQVANGPFNDGANGWEFNGNHSESYVEELASENGNPVAHLIASEAGGSYGNSVVGRFASPVAIGTPLTLQFRTRNAEVQSPEWTWFLVGNEPPPEIVLNEVMYHPNQSNEVETLYEYIELFNPGGAPINLSGWTVSGVRYTLPPGTTLGPGEYLVCCASTNAIIAEYGRTNVVGNWAGSLKNGGETIKLINSYGRQEDSVVYADNKEWPVAADGYGPSLERIDPSSSGNTSVNWMASSRASDWVKASWTGEISSANTGARFFLNFPGKCLVDEVSVQPLGGSGELVVNGDFESAANGWTFHGNHGRSRIESGAGRSGSAALAVYGMQSRWVRTSEPEPLLIVHGDSVSNCVASAALPTTNGKPYVVSCWIKHAGPGEDLLLVIGTTTNTLRLGSRGTPGQPNAVPTNALPMGVTSLYQAFKTCPVNTQNLIRAYVTPASLVQSVHINYRTFSTNGYEFTDEHYSSLPMLDDGNGPDETADDGEYAAYIPGISTNDSIVRYHITVTATNGYQRDYPDRENPTRDRGYWVQSNPPPDRRVELVFL